MLRLLRLALLFAALAALGPAAPARAEGADAAPPLLLAHSEEYCPKCPSQGQAASSATKEDATSVTEEEVRRYEEERRRAITDALRARILQRNGEFFEVLAIDVLSATGLGDDFEWTGGAGDRGIDVCWKKKPFGEPGICAQMKRLKKDKVNGGPMAKFCENLRNRKADAGIFITTTSFTEEGERAADQCDRQIVLYDWDRFSREMLEQERGVDGPRVYRFYDFDDDYFREVNKKRIHLKNLRTLEREWRERGGRGPRPEGLPDLRRNNVPQLSTFHPIPGPAARR